MADPQADHHPVRLTVLATSLGAVLVAVAVAFFLRNVFVSGRTPIVWTVAAIVLTALLTPIVNRLGRKIPRVIAAALVLLTLAGAYFLVGYRFIDDLSTGIDRLRTELPRAAGELEANSHVLQEFELTKRVTEWVNQLPNQSIQPSNAASTVVNFFVAGTVTLFLMLYGPRIFEAGFRQIRDERRRTELRRFTFVAMARTQRYVVGSLAGMTAFGVATYIICRVIDLPTPTPLAVIVGLLAALPYFGVVLGAIPVLLLDGGLSSPGHAGYLFLLFAAMQVAQVQLWKRWVQPRSLYVGPAVIAIVGLIGFDLYGLGGLLFSSVIGVFLLALGDAASNSNVRWAGRPPHAAVAGEPPGEPAAGGR